MCTSITNAHAALSAYPHHIECDLVFVPEGDVKEKKRQVYKIPRIVENIVEDRQDQQKKEGTNKKEERGILKKKRKTRRLWWTGGGGKKRAVTHTHTHIHNPTTHHRDWDRPLVTQRRRLAYPGINSWKQMLSASPLQVMDVKGMGRPRKVADFCVMPPFTVI